MSDLRTLEAWAGALLSNLEALARRALARAVATEMRRRQGARIAEQRNPDGSAYEPRKPQLRLRPGRVRRAMFARLRTTRFLKMETSPDAAVVTFVGRAQRIAAVHQFGLRDRVNRAGLEVTYPQRELLGFDDADVDRITDLVLAHLTA
ncbi:phage virion morphogenesis protein [Cupriavidus taiwanensis]|uniref:Bacteriophage P2 Tail completion protein GPS n=1 Tax=Cupriavidus taiwanensis (strain DSM 17343 / BCRC 17206 / CCUG 44338 / CIP 107171 / LMG 19424 / R1) TaxID=977880 RepID=B3R3K6_CUPTR|nr:phage virion morphogenesis protein [Cupriavidus taiwanensis]CAQ68888.1 bacteriophage P2 Tail completion protein GPS [Cupriavidus taiwanensis LMG 19424]